MLNSIVKHLLEVKIKAGGRAIAEGTRNPRLFASRIGEWVSYTTTSFGEIVLDDQPTQISDVKVHELTPTSAIITWKTNHLATSKVNYGLTKDYGKDVQPSKKVHDHRIEITGLEPGVTYNYEVMSQNKNYVYDANHEFTTPVEDGEQVKGAETVEQFVTVVGSMGERVRIRTNPTLESNIVTEVTVGDRLVYKDQKDNWMNVTIDDKEGWIFSELVEIEK